MSTGNKEYRHELRHHFLGQMQKTQIQVSSPHRHFMRGNNAAYDDISEVVQAKEQPKKPRQTKSKSKTMPSNKPLQQQPAPPRPPQQGTREDQHHKQRQTKQEANANKYYHHHQQQHDKREPQACCPHLQQRHQKQQASKVEKSGTRANARQGGGDAKREYKETTEERHVGHNHLVLEKEMNFGATSSLGYPQTPVSRDESVFKESTGMSYARQSSASQLDRYSIFDLCSNLNLMSDSDKSARTSKTVVSRASAHDLRQMVRSQIALQNVLDESLSVLSREREAKKKAATATEITNEEVTKSFRSIKLVPPTQLTQLYPAPSYPCPHCSGPINNAEKPSSENANDQTRQSAETGSPFSVSIDDLVNSKVINPMIRKLQRMYLNSLKEEMSLMEDLEQLPRIVSEVYNSNVHK